ncbi:MAG: efflux RND transporter periplasmic adaptor subunit [Planctomycetaceae bacterium]|nr:efflux RND transporter periplasmic adaptor subunit [Planctomycetaceae bacterium]
MSLACCWVCFAAVTLAAGPQDPAGGSDIVIPSMLLRLVEQADVPARESGVLASIDVVEGQMVEEGAAVAHIDDTQARLAAEHAQTELEIARANAANTVNVRFARKSVEVAEAELRRSTESNERYSKSISESEMDRLRLIVEKARLELEQSEHEFTIAGFNHRVKENDYQAAQQLVEQHKITAPLAGVVVQVHRHRGEWVKPGDAVVRILRLDRLRAEGFVPMEHWSHDLQGRPVRVLVDLPTGAGVEVPGKIVFVDPEIDPFNAQIRIWAEVENSELQLRPGMKSRMIVERKPAG